MARHPSASRAFRLPEEPPTIPAAFAEARAAQFEWTLLPPRDRVALLRRFRGLLAEHAGELANVVPRPAHETLSAQVLPLAEAVRFLERHLADWLRPVRLGRRGRPGWLFGVEAEIRREPAGVVLIIAPSNYPVFLPGVQVVQALAAGNAVLLKPGPAGRPAALALRRLLLASGLLPGLFAVLPETPDAALEAIDLGPDHIVLTGSTATGRSVLRRAAEVLAPCTTELSGCDPVIVRADADLDRVVEALVFGLSLNAGATCIAPRRVFVPRVLSSELERRLARALVRVPRVPFDALQRPRLDALVAEATARGARVVGPHPAPDASGPGPLVLWQAPADLAGLRDAWFAPVLVVTETDHDDQAVAFAHRSSFALGASIFGGDVAACRRLAESLRAGFVSINDLVFPSADPRLPFGGRGQSGFGLTRGKEGFLELTRAKAVAIRRGRWAPHLEPARVGDAEFFAALLRSGHAATPSGRFAGLIDLLRRAMRRGRSSPFPLSHS